MGWESGVYVRKTPTYSGSNCWVDEDAGGFNIEADRSDFHDQDMANGISATLNRHGENGMEASLSMGGYKITGLGDGVNPTDAVTFQQLAASAELPVGAADGDMLYWDDSAGSWEYTASIKVNGSDMTVSGAMVVAGNLDALTITSGNITSTGNVAATTFSGGAITSTGNVDADTFTGDGSGLTGIPINADIQYGYVNDSGTKVSGSSGWSSSRSGEGIYALTFTDAATSTNTQVVICTPVGNPSSSFPPTTSFAYGSATLVAVYTAVNGLKTDLSFNFIRIRY